MANGSIAWVLPRIGDPELEFRKYLNLLLALAERRARAEVVHAGPVEVTIDPSTVCQLSCPHCEVGNGTIQRARSILDPAVHARMLDQLGPGVFVAWYFSTGEPLLNKHLVEIVSLARARGIFPIVSTNLSLPLSDDRIDALLQSGLGVVSVSLDGASPETYARYRVGGDFALVVSNLRRLVQRKARLGLEHPLIEWRFLVFRHNQHEIPDVRRLAREYGVDLLELYRGFAPPEARDGEVQLAVDPELEPAVSGPALVAARARTDTPLRARLRGRAWERRAPREGYHDRCDWLYLGATLFPSQAVSPCCLSNNEPDDFGALSAATSFAEVWNNERFREARRLFVRGGPSALVCARCPNTVAHHEQFRATLCALVRNAPDWALAILARDPDRFLSELDRARLAAELEALHHRSVRPRRPLAEMVDRLGREAEARAVARGEILSLRQLLLESEEDRRGRSRWRRLLGLGGRAPRRSRAP